MLHISENRSVETLQHCRIIATPKDECHNVEGFADLTVMHDNHIHDSFKK